MHQQERTIKRPTAMLPPDSSTVLLVQAAALATSTECHAANPMLDEWIMLARTLLDVMTQL